MSTSLNVMTATNFDKFMEQYEQVKLTEQYNNDPIGVLIDMLDDFTQYYTNFSGNIGRLYDVVEKGELLQNDFANEYECRIYKLNKKDILDIVNASDNVKLVNKWEDIMESFDDCEPTETIYCIVD